MQTRRLILATIVLCSLFPASSHAVDGYVNPPAPTDTDSVTVSVVGCHYADYCTIREESFTCSVIDAHTFEIDVINRTQLCLPQDCFICAEPYDCGYQDELGRCYLGTLAAGHYVVHITYQDWYLPQEWDISFDVAPTPTGVGTTPSAPLISVAPNPFASSANIEFAMGKRSRARLEVFDVRGSRVRTLVDEIMDAPGSISQWDGRDASGRRQPSGVYFVRLTLDGVAVAARRIVLLR